MRRRRGCRRDGGVRARGLIPRPDHEHLHAGPEQPADHAKVWPALVALGIKLVAGVHKQVGLVRAALEAAGLADVPVRGVLCFVEADWPLFGGSFVIDGVWVLWPKKLAEQLLAPGPLDDAMTNRVYRALAGAFPLA